MKKILTILILSLTLAGAGCSFFAQNRPEQEEITQEPVEIKEEVDISDWQTYTNEEYRFSFMYPENWHIDRDGEQDAVKGGAYSIRLKDNKNDSIFFYITTPDFISEEGEGSPVFLTGDYLVFDDTISKQLEEKKMYFHKEIKKLENGILYFNHTEYTDYIFGVNAIFQNKEKTSPFLLAGIALGNFEKENGQEQIDKGIESYLNGAGEKQWFYNEYIKIIDTIRY